MKFFNADGQDKSDMNPITRIQEINRRGGLIGISTGVKTLDMMMYGFLPGRLYIIGARPSIGKTSLMTYMALAAAESGHKTTIISAEMSNEDMAEKLVTQHAQIATRSECPYTPEEAETLTKSYKELCNLPLQIHDLPLATITEIRKAIRVKPDILFVDHFHNLGHEAYTTEGYKKTCQNLWKIARELKIPVVVLAQTNRNTETEEDCLRLGLLKDCGNLEQDAWFVCYLFQPQRGKAIRNQASTSENELLIAIPKNRSGRVGTCSVGIKNGIIFKREYRADVAGNNIYKVAAAERERDKEFEKQVPNLKSKKAVRRRVLDSINEIEAGLS